MAHFDSYDAEDPAVLRALSFDFGITSLLDGLSVRLSQQEPSPALIDTTARQSTAGQL